MAKAAPAPRPPPNKSLRASVDACIANGDRLLDDAMWVEHLEPPGTSLMLSMIAQEEFAKAFLLFLVHQAVIPWSPYLLRAMNDHSCKQLVGVIIDYVDPVWDTLEQLQAIYREESERGERLPADVGSALDILRHEKIGRWTSNTWIWAEEPTYDPEVLRIAAGRRDRLKQDALYVRLARDGRVVSVPASASKKEAKAEYERAKRYSGWVHSLVQNKELTSIQYEKVREGFRVLFREEN